MLLADLKLIEVCALEISFQHHIAMPGQGKIKVEYGAVEFEVGSTLVDAPENSTIIIKATPCIKGFRDDMDKEDFNLTIKIRMVYSYPNSAKIDENFLKENNWYFGSYLKTYFKFYADETLSKTTINGIKLDYN
ncbi:hypothetical protein [Pantoea stewartii]|uniref:hypothetical protein n=1 Tax=Pantoea stewartii TaxID=66269 RepID=UPI00197F8F96|nr:hypothetical protein [Pantoea stewartii]